MEMKIMLDATPVLLASLESIASALRGLSTPAQTHSQTPPQAQEQVASQSAAPATSIPQQTAPAQEPAPVAAPSVPTTPAPAHVQEPSAPTAQPPAQAPVLTQAPAAMPTTYTPEQVNAACAALIDAGRVGELKKILRDQFGADSLQKLAPEQLAEFVVIVRGLGAAI